MRPTHEEIDAACRRLARVASFPSFGGGVYAFTANDLTTGAWFARGSDNPLIGLAELAIEVPRAGLDARELVEARCRIAVENALAARLTS